MSSADFVATLLRTSARGFAGLAASRTAERCSDATLFEGRFEAWKAHFGTLVDELAVAVEDGVPSAFSMKVAWTREAFRTRGLALETLSIGLEELEAVLKESLPADAWGPMPAYFEAARTELNGDDPFSRRQTSATTDAIIDAYLDKLLEGDGPGAIAAVIEAVEAGSLSIVEALEDVMTGALHEIGRRWHIDAINVAQEHFASQVSGRLIERLALRTPARQPNGYSVLLTMIEGDAHDLGLRIVAALFELDGWRTICLGANMPGSELPQAIEDFDVDLLLLGATLNPQRDAVARTISALRKAGSKIKILAGGPAFGECAQRAEEIGADGCALHPSTAVALGRKLLGF